MSVQIISPGTGSMSGEAAMSMVLPSALDEDEGQQAADEPVEHDCLGECEAEPLDARQLATQFRLPCDGLDHAAEDVADADAGAERAEADAERERDRLAGVDVRGGFLSKQTEQL